ncbi:MAG: hypothetical protein A2506_13010 [Elusimicrobia bacterium RIFOXYD12_FULL_66_9]|nr:MAG: hypothetical protein A2506_13010 [Elusimicrobia bacterium RIFOXYD12_FULL_66_9]
MDAAVKSLTYRFRMNDGRQRDFVVRLRRPRLDLETSPRTEFPAWTALEFNKCPNCPLKPKDTPRCPVGVSLIDLVDLFKDCLSTEIAEVTILCDDREYRKTGGVQFGISSLMGLYMATSGCPVIDKLRPMVLTHLPFATLEESTYRSLSMYLVAQHLRHRRGEEADWDLKELLACYEGINAVNKAFIQRLHSVAPKDASANALVNLDCLAGYARFSFQKNYFDKLEEVFFPYFATPSPG